MNEVIVLGPDHYNTLGVVRSLGEAGIKPIVVIYSEKSQNSFVLKSKYIKTGTVVEKCDSALMGTLAIKYNDSNNKAILIGTSDHACITIDANLDRLKNFICASCGNQSNGILFWMDKYRLNEMASRVGLKVPHCQLIKSTEKINISDIKLPCIVKPLESALGSKSDIAVCKTRTELDSAYDVFSRQGIDILVQDYIVADYELGLMGCSYYNNNRIYIPDVIYKKRFSNKSAVFSEIHNSDINPELSDTIQAIVKLINSIKYKGIFDVDLLYSDGHYYFIEVNFRNGAYGYGLTKAGVNFPEIWCKEALKNYYLEVKIQKTSYMMSEFSDFKQIRNNGISIRKWWSDFIKSTHMVFQLKDVAPTVAYIRSKINESRIDKIR